MRPRSMLLRRVLLVFALGVGRHAKAHAHGDHRLASGGSRGRGESLGAPPLKNGPEDGRGAGGGACAVSSMRMMYDLMVFCREKRWQFERAPAMNARWGNARLLRYERANERAMDAAMNARMNAQ